MQAFFQKQYVAASRQLLLIFYGIIYCVVLQAQSTKAPPLQNWGIRAGWTQTLLSDQHASPLLYQADAMNIGGIYQRQGDAFFEIALTLQVGTNQAQRHGQRIVLIEDTPDIYGEIETFELEANPFLSMLVGDLRIKTLWSLNQYHALGVSFNARHILTGVGADTWHYTQLDIAPEYSITYTIGNLEARASGSLPLLAAVVRPNYAYDPSLPNTLNYWWGYVKTGTSITSVHQLLNPRASASLLWHFKNGRDVGVSYAAAWTSFPDPRPVRVFENSIDLIYFF
ncbi:MAG: hypothetical protein AAF847_01895 [Bacteroidota bacterium]